MGSRRRLTAVDRAVSELIARYDLHTRLSVPVPIRHIARNEGWVVVYSEQMGRLYGVAVVHERLRLMRINADVTPSFQRMAIAHEMAHVLNGDIESIQLCAASVPAFRGWLNRRQERQASLTAARILIPDWVLAEIQTVDEIATACEVPRELVELLIDSR